MLNIILKSLTVILARICDCMFVLLRILTFRIAVIFFSLLIIIYVIMVISAIQTLIQTIIQILVTELITVINNTIQLTNILFFKRNISTLNSSLHNLYLLLYIILINFIIINLIKIFKIFKKYIYIGYVYCNKHKNSFITIVWKLVIYKATLLTVWVFRIINLLWYLIKKYKYQILILLIYFLLPWIISTLSSFVKYVQLAPRKLYIILYHIVMQLNYTNQTVLVVVKVIIPLILIIIVCILTVIKKKKKITNKQYFTAMFILLYLVLMLIIRFYLNYR